MSLENLPENQYPVAGESYSVTSTNILTTATSQLYPVTIEWSVSHPHRRPHHYFHFQWCSKMFSPGSALLALVLLTLVTSHIDGVLATRCEIARVKCAYRVGCGFSLHSYMVECADLIAGRTTRCHPRCERALIALVSSEEGKELVNCECEGSPFCVQSKQRIEVCRSAVYKAVAKESIVSCTTARWICMADPLCNTALDYYHLYCRGLFHGHKCTNRCNNSLSILDRQEKASKLRTCYCDGTEDFPCQRVKYNTERYCYGKMVPPPPHTGLDNSISVIVGDGSDYNRYRHLNSGTKVQWTSAGWMLVGIVISLRLLVLAPVTQL